MVQYALLVGVSHFENNLDIVDYAEDDVRGFSDVLMNNMDIPYENIQELINECATSTAIQTAINTICEKAQAGDRIFCISPLTEKPSVVRHFLLHTMHQFIIIATTAGFGYPI